MIVISGLNSFQHLYLVFRFRALVCERTQYSSSNDVCLYFCLAIFSVLFCHWNWKFIIHNIFTIRCINSVQKYIVSKSTPKIDAIQAGLRSRFDVKVVKEMRKNIVRYNITTWKFLYAFSIHRVHRKCDTRLSCVISPETSGTQLKRWMEHLYSPISLNHEVRGQGDRVIILSYYTRTATKEYLESCVFALR